MSQVTVRRRAGVFLWLLAAAIVAVPVTVGAAPASAHASFLGADPKDGATVPEAPQTVTLNFSEQIDPQFVTVNLRLGAGDIQQLKTDTTGNAVVATTPESVVSAGAAGPWQVDYRVVSADGHPITGSTGFTVAEDASGAASSSPGVREDPSPGETPPSADAEVIEQPGSAAPVAEGSRAWLATLLIGLFVAAVVAVLLVWLSRGRRSAG